MGVLILAASRAVSLPSLQFDPINPGLGLTLHARSLGPECHSLVAPSCPALSWHGRRPLLSLSLGGWGRTRSNLIISSIFRERRTSLSSGDGGPSLSKSHSALDFKMERNPKVFFLAECLASLGRRLRPMSWRDVLGPTHTSAVTSRSVCTAVTFPCGPPIRL